VLFIPVSQSSSLLGLPVRISTETENLDLVVAINPYPRPTGVLVFFGN
jgi:hypothetical protein